jgi:hypothetical protein
MFSILTATCHNDSCTVNSFTYASCEPPICPACQVCADCGYEEFEHEDGSCPTDNEEENEEEENNEEI